MVILQAVQIRTGCEDKEGRLVFVTGELVAVLVRLDDEVHGDDRGRWFLEAGFGPLDEKPDPFFDLGAAESWLRKKLLNGR